MSTSRKTREYWVGHAKEWAEIRLTHPDYGATPQLDEFVAVMDELMAESLEAEGLRKVLARTRLELDHFKRVASLVDRYEHVFDQIWEAVHPGSPAWGYPGQVVEAVRVWLERERGGG